MPTPDCRASRPTPFGLRKHVATTALAATLGSAGMVRAERWTAVPSLSVSASYDDNLLMTDPARRAVGLRVGPALVVGYQPTARLMFMARAGSDSEYFGDPQVTRWAAGRTASLMGRYQIGANTSASVGGQYTLTSHPGELLPHAGLDYGRRRAESLSAELAIDHRVGPRLTLRGGYTVQSVRLEGGGRGLGSQLANDTSLVLRVAPHTTLTLRAGPRYLERSLSAHVGADLERALARARVSVGYHRGRNLSFDRVMLTESYTGRLSYELSRTLAVNASPAVYRHWVGSDPHRSWRLGAEASWRASPLVTARAAYDFSVQDRGLFIGDIFRQSGARQLSRHSAVVGITVMPTGRESRP